MNSSHYEESFDFETSGFNCDDADDILNVAISEQDRYTAIRNLKSGKSAGFGGILNEYIKCTQNILMPLYSKLLNIIFETGTLPDTWLEGRIRPILKNKADKSKPVNYRPITVLSCLSKLFTSILNNRLTQFLDLFDGTNENQAGFRKGYSTIDQYFCLNTLIEFFKAQKKKIYSAFIDFSQAFDSVWRSGLWRKLLDNHINGKFFRVIHNMYMDI